MRNSFIRIVTFFACAFAILYFGVSVLFSEPVDDPEMASVKGALSAQISTGKVEIPVSEIFPATGFENAEFCMKSFESDSGRYGISFFLELPSQEGTNKRSVPTDTKSMFTLVRSVIADGRTYRFSFEDAKKRDCAPYLRAVFRVVQDSQTERFSLMLAEKSDLKK